MVILSRPLTETGDELYNTLAFYEHLTKVVEALSSRLHCLEEQVTLLEESMFFIASRSYWC